MSSWLNLSDKKDSLSVHFGDINAIPQSVVWKLLDQFLLQSSKYILRGHRQRVQFYLTDWVGKTKKDIKKRK